MNKQKIITWGLFFLVFFVILQWMQGKKQEVPSELKGTLVALAPAKNAFATGEEVIIKIRNNTEHAVLLPSNCPKNPLRVLAWTGEKFEEKSADSKIDCANFPQIVIAPQKESPVSFSFWNHSLFGNPGRFKTELVLSQGTTTGTFASSEFTVVEAGFWRKSFRAAFYQPIYNVLIFLVSAAPARDLGLAIILLTIIIRLILLIPSQRAIVSQRKMQELQPKLEHIKKKYAGNQERIAQETMNLWKQNKVNPFGSCLPIIIQFPVLIALFYVIQNGLNPDNTYLLYSPFKNFDFTNIHTHFLGILELTRVNTFVLPLIVGGLQFLQLKLAMLKKKKPEAAGGSPENRASEMEQANKMMVYMMPVMIAVFTASVPAGVGLYWGVSTVFAIGQQMVANKKAVV